MKVGTEIRQMPWPEPWRGGQQDFIVSFSWPVIDHERLLVATFVRNRNKRTYYRETGPDFRLICSKRNRRARILFQGARAAKRQKLRDALWEIHAHADTCYPEISEKDERALGRWLGIGPEKSHNHLIPQLSDWVSNAVDEEARQEKVAKGEIMNEDVKLCPEELPEGLVEYIRNTVLPQDDVLLYKKGNARGTCFLCREKVKAHPGVRFRSSEYVTCPNCGRRVYALLETSDRFWVDYVENIATIQLGRDGTTLFVRQWHLNRDFTARWNDIPGQLEEVARYAIRGNHAGKWQSEAKENWYMKTTRYKLKEWTRVRDVAAVYDGGCYIYIPENWREILARTSLRYCDLEDYRRSVAETRNTPYTIRLLTDWARYPVLEKFWKAGYTTIAHEKLRGFYKQHRYAINWKRDSIAGAIKFPKRLLKMWMPEEWNMDRMQKVADIWKLVAAGKVKESEIPDLANSTLNFKEIEPAFGHASVRKILKYAGANQFHTYRDYLNDCVKLKWDLDDPQILFPRDLDAAHQRSLEQVKYDKTKIFEEKYQATRQKALWQEWEQGGLLIRWPETGEEIIREGMVLHHCVGGYVNRAAEGKTTILLIRKKDQPHTPFYTLEWNGNMVVQCKSLHNKDFRQDPEVAGFVDAWTEHIRRLKKNRKKEKAA